MLARAHKKVQRGQNSETYLLTLREQDKTKMELPLGMVSKHAFWYLYLPDYFPISWFWKLNKNLLLLTKLAIYLVFEKFHLNEFITRSFVLQAK